MSDKNDIIAKAYNEFYGSVKDTYNLAKKSDKSITLAEVKKWFDGNFARKTNLRGFNSYVAQKPYEEYQIDLFFMPESDGEEYRQALMMIDIFSKFMTVVPLKEKQAVPVLEAIKEGISNMGRKPEVIYSDDEGSFNSKQAQDYYDRESIKHLITRGHAPVAERAVRTLKNMLYKRMEAKPDLSWYDADVLSNALTTYNYRNTHTSINMTPNEARKDSNTMTVKTKLEVNRVQKRKYPNLEEGDEVRIYTKRKNVAKERVPVWSETKHKVVSIQNSHGQRFYKVEGRDKPLMRHELLKV